jgi:serine/threonine protein kinase
LLKTLNVYFPDLNVAKTKNFYLIRDKKGGVQNFMFIQEYYQYGDLADKFTQTVNLSLMEKKELFNNVKNTLVKLQKMGIVMLDFKLENVVLNKQGIPVLIDFDDCFVSKKFQKTFGINWTQGYVFGTINCMHPQYYSMFCSRETLKLESHLNINVAKKYLAWSYAIFATQIVYGNDLWETPSVRDEQFKWFIKYDVLPEADRNLSLKEYDNIDKSIRPHLSVYLKNIKNLE